LRAPIQHGAGDVGRGEVGRRVCAGYIQRHRPDAHRAGGGHFWLLKGGSSWAAMMEELQKELEATRAALAETRGELAENKSELAETKSTLAALKRELMRQHLITWEDDDDGTRLPGQWVNVRIFLSSSFVDTQAERDMIIQRVLPKLNFELQKNFVRCARGHTRVQCNAVLGAPWYACVRVGGGVGGLKVGPVLITW